MSRSYRFVAGEDSLQAFRRLRRGWAGYRLVDGELHVRLLSGGSVRIHVDTMEIEPDFVVASVVADAFDYDLDVPSVPSPFEADGNDVLVFRGLSWIETGPGRPQGTTLVLSGPPHAAPDASEAVCDTTDAVAVLSPGGSRIVRVGLKPGQVEWVDDADEVAAFLSWRGYGDGGPSR